VILSLWAVRVGQHKMFSLLVSPLTLPISLLLISLGLSSILNPPVLSESLTSIYGSLFFMFVTVLIAPSLIKIKSAKLYFELLLAVGIGLSLITLLQTLGIGPSQFLNKIFK